MKKKMIMKNIEEKKINYLLDESLLYIVNEEDKNLFRMQWLDDELEKVDMLLKEAHQKLFN